MPLVVLLLAPGAGWAQTANFGRNPEPEFALGSSRAGDSPAHALRFSVSRGELELYRASVSYPQGFRFNGFDALGPAGSQVGALEIDGNRDGNPDAVVEIRSLGRHTAWADVIADGQLSVGLEPVLDHLGGGQFLLLLPLGGDANPSTVTVAFDARVSLVLFPGLLTSPEQAGTYVVKAELLSVDPDTGGPDDRAGLPPRMLAFEVSIEIEAPPLVPFAGFCVDQAHLDAAGFRALGRYVLGAASDGISFPRDAVTVALGPFRQVIPGSTLSPLGRGAQFNGPGPGVRRLHVGDDGRFQVDIRDVNLGAIDPAQVTFALTFGDDGGEASLAFDRVGNFLPPRTPRCAP